jgi:hypothetical protein
MKKTLLTTLLLSISLSASTGILKEDANFRDKPSLKALKVNTLRKGEEVKIIKKVVSDKYGTWYETNKGFISLELIQTNNSKISRDVNKDKKYFVKTPKTIMKIKKKKEIVKPITPPIEIVIEETVLEEIVNDQEVKPVEEIQVVVHTKEEPIQTKVVETTNDNKYFLAVSTGLSQMSVKQNDKVGSFPILSLQPDTQGMNLNVELGYNYTKDTFVTVGLHHQKYNDINLYNYLVSYNKKLDYKYNPYIGVIAGISYIELTKSHINSTLPDKQGRELVYGLQTGLEHKLKKDLTLFTNFQYLKANHKTELLSRPAESEFERDDYTSISFGVRWEFDNIIQFH